MTTSRIYVLPLPLVGQRQPDSNTRNDLEAAGVLGSDTGAVETIATQPRTQTVSGYYRGQLAWKLAAELQELASLESPVSIYGTREADAAGYFAIEKARSRPVEAPVADWLQQYTLTLTREGTRADNRRAIRTTVSQVDHPFGSSLTAEVGAPADATGVEWLDEESEKTTDPTLVATRSAELGDIEVYDARAAPYDNPTLVYDIPYADEGPVDVRVWDERSVGSKTDSDGVLQWAKVFSTGHDYAGEAILDNGLVRLRFADAGLSAERWDDGTGTWTSQSLGTSDWSLRDVDIRHIGVARADARVRFTDGSTVFPLDVSLKRGWTDPLWSEIDGQGGTPTGLVDLLDPIADAQTFSPGATQGLVDRGAM